MPSDLHSLAASAEAADPSEQREVLIAAWEHLFPAPDRYRRRQRERIEHWRKFAKMLDAEAYESAAIMLVDPLWLGKAGELWDGDRKCGWATVHRYSKTDAGMMWDDQHDTVARTPALALVAACLKARATQGENDG
jgi:hypothetical protein